MIHPTRLHGRTFTQRRALTYIRGHALLVHTSANIFGLAFPALAALVAIPYLVDELGIRVFGFFSLQLAVLYFLGAADFGIARTIVLSVSADQGRLAWRHSYRAGMSCTMLLSVALLCLSLPIGLLSWVLGIGDEYAGDVAASTSIMIVAAALTLLCLPPRAVLEIQARFPVMNAIRGLSGAAVFIAPLCVMSFSHELTAISVSIAGVRLCALVAFLSISGAGIPLGGEVAGAELGSLSSEKTYQRRFLHRLGWIGVTNTISPLLGHLDRFFLGALLSAAAVGQYAIGHELATKVSLLVGAATSASFPRLIAESVDKDSASFRKLVRATTNLVILLGCVPSIGLVVFAQDIISIWLGNRHAYSSAVLPMQILAVGIGLNSLSQVNFALLLIFGGERAGAMLQVIQIPILVLLLLLLVPTYGLAGAAVAISTRLFVDGLILRWMVVKQHQGHLVPGVGSRYLVAAALIGTVLLLVVQPH